MVGYYRKDFNSFWYNKVVVFFGFEGYWDVFFFVNGLELDSDLLWWIVMEEKVL